MARDVSSAVAGRIVAELSAVGSLLIPASSMSTYDGEEEEAMLDRILSIRYLFDLHGQLDAARHLHLGRIARHPLALAQAAWRLLPTLLDIVTCIPFYAVGGFSVSHLLCEYEFDRDCCRPRVGVMAHSGHLHIITLMACSSRLYFYDPHSDFLILPFYSRPYFQATWMSHPFKQAWQIQWADEHLGPQQPADAPLHPANGCVRPSSWLERIA